jgi:hypothetical protein
MGRSNPNENNVPQNPAKIFAEWKGQGFVYYDKVKKENVALPKDLKFVVLDELNTIKGFHKPSKSGIFSNEVRNLSKETLTVKSFGDGLIAEGFYKEISDKIKVNGGKFSKSVYVGFLRADGTLTLGNIAFTGADLGAWFDFTKDLKDNSLYKGAVQLTGSKEEVNGANHYHVPLFGLIDISAQTDDLAGELQITLKEYQKKYFNAADVTEVAQEELYNPFPDPDVPENQFQDDNGEKELDPKYISQEEIDKNMAGESPPLPF